MHTDSPVEQLEQPPERQLHQGQLEQPPEQQQHQGQLEQPPERQLRQGQLDKEVQKPILLTENQAAVKPFLRVKSDLLKGKLILTL